MSYCILNITGYLQAVDFCVDCKEGNFSLHFLFLNVLLSIVSNMSVYDKGFSEDFWLLLKQYSC